MADLHFLNEVLILLAAAVLVVGIFGRLHLTPLLGFIVAGTVIGPHGFGLIAGVDVAHSLAELGIVFLLFMIGLELSFSRLKALGSLIFGLGTAQLLITGAVFFGVAYLMGASSDTAIIAGVGLGMSSTAIVLQILMDRRAQNTETGRVSIAILLFQDLALVPALVLLPLLADDGGNLGQDLLAAFVKAAIALGAIILVGRYAIRPVLRAVVGAGGSELLTAAAMLVILGTALLTETAGLSLALGAFLAGLLIAETEFRHHIEADIRPFRGLLLGLFFMTVGMGIDLEYALATWPLLISFVIGISVIKAAIIFALCMAWRQGAAVSVHAALLLAQGGEFAFLLTAMSRDLGIIDNASAQFLLAMVTLSMAITPFLAILGNRAGRWFAARADSRLADGLEASDDRHDDGHDDGHVIIAGYGRVGQTIAGILSQADLGHVAVDRDPTLVKVAAQTSVRFSYGDATRPTVLSAAGLGQAAAVVITIDDTEGAQRLVQAVRQLSPDIPILARAHNRIVEKELFRAGATIVVQETFEASLQLSTELLELVDVPEGVRDRAIDEARAEKDLEHR